METKGDLAAARADYRKALELDPEDEAAREGLARLADG
jgi:Flp pilus assembly protein TadD